MREEREVQFPFGIELGGMTEIFRAGRFEPYPTSLSLTPNFSWVQEGGSQGNRFSGFSVIVFSDAPR